jgi:type IV secretion system protein TrbJ
MKIFVHVFASLCLLGFALSAQAQFAVIDPANLAQNILSAARALTQVENQLRQLQNEAQMLTNQARNLQSLDFNSLNRLRSTLATTQRLLDEAEGLAFELARVRQQFEDLYPREYTSVFTRERMLADAWENWRRTRAATETALSMQAQATENFAADEAVLSDLIGRSQAAAGALQAAQATNQLLALHARQAIQAQQLQIVQDRAAAVEQARTIAAETRAREVRNRFQGNGVRYTPYPVEF